MASQSSSGRSRPSSDAMADWSIGAKIGKGSFASVYQGTHKVSSFASPTSSFSHTPIRPFKEQPFGGELMLGIVDSDHRHHNLSRHCMRHTDFFVSS